MALLNDVRDLINIRHGINRISGCSCILPFHLLLTWKMIVKQEDFHRADVHKLMLSSV